jgi:hypothetical protein
VVLAAGLLLAKAAAVHAGTLVPVAPVPGSTRTVVFAINNNNVVTGYEMSSTDGLEHPFVGPYTGSYTVFHLNGAKSGRAFGISDDGVVVGTELYSALGEYVPFVRQMDGRVRIVRSPDGYVVNGAAYDVRDNGLFVAASLNGSPFFGRGARYTAPLAFPLPAGFVYPIGYDQQDTVTGYFLDTQDYSVPGFILKGSEVTVVHYPASGAVEVPLSGMNGSGIVSGNWQDSSNNPHAFLFDTNANAFKAIDKDELAFAGNINDDGLVPVNVGTYSASMPYLYCPRRPRLCPVGAGPSREVADRWIPAPEGTVRKADAIK